MTIERNPSIELLASAMADSPAYAQVRFLEEMHERVLDLGQEEAEKVLLIEGLTQGRLGGQLAMTRRTLTLQRLFYKTDSSGEPLPAESGVGIVPFLPVDDFELMNKINSVGHRILETLSKKDKVKLDRDRLGRR